MATAIKCTPKAGAAVHILSNNNAIKDLDLSGDGAGRGVEVFNAKNTSLTGLTILNREMGIDVYYEGNGCEDTVIKNNRITGSKRFALRIHAPDCGAAHTRKNNDFTGSGDYAVYLKKKEN